MNASCTATSTAAFARLLRRSAGAAGTVSTVSAVSAASTASIRPGCLFTRHTVRAPPRQPLARRFSTAASTTTATPSFAFAFDIDGVLLHVTDPIPGAAAALRHLHALGIPFILLTNGGGRHEADRVADLQQRLGLDAGWNSHPGTSKGACPPLPVLSTANFVQSHTPFQELVDDVNGLGGDTLRTAASASGGLRDKTILVTGSDAARARTIAERYGFSSVVTPADLLAAHPTIWPFNPLLRSVYADTARPLPKPLLLEGGKRASVAAGAAGAAELDESRYLRIAAAFVFNDPRDWALDIQLLTDLLQSRQGFLGTFDPETVSGASPSSSLASSLSATLPRIFFSNGDLLWATNYHLPRLAQGAFAAAVSGVWAQLAHGQELLPHRATVLGKPHPATYRYAERMLLRYRAALLQERQPQQAPQQSSPQAASPPLQTVYMVGDNPESDIAGANQFRSAHGTDWCSVLVGTGVYNAARDGASAEHLRHRPRVIVDDVGAAVRWALQREGWPADF